MATCREIRKHVDVLATQAELPSWVQAHLAGCPACADAVAAERLASGLLRAAPVDLLPPQGFAGRVEARLAAATKPSTDTGDLWRPAWGLVPTFAAILLALVVLQQGVDTSEPVGLFPVENTTAAEQLLMTTGNPNLDLVLQMVLEDDDQ